MLRRRFGVACQLLEEPVSGAGATQVFPGATLEDSQNQSLAVNNWQSEAWADALESFQSACCKCRLRWH